MSQYPHWLIIHINTLKVTDIGDFLRDSGEHPQTPLKKTAQFCELLSSERLCKLCETLATSNSELLGPFC